MEHRSSVAIESISEPSEQRQARLRSAVVTHAKRFARRWRGDLVLLCVTAGFLSWILLWQYSLFARSEFNFNDLTVINDWFSNTLFHGHPFWLTDEGKTHLRVHFTPSLLLLTPLFKLFSSQFALIAVIAGTVYTGVYVAARDVRITLRRAGAPPVYTWILTLAFLTTYALNRYTLRVVSSAHFEPAFVFAAALLLSSMCRQVSLWVRILLLLITLGVRQDTGLCVVFLLLSCLFAPRAWRRCDIKSVVVLAAISVIYMALVVKVVMPLLGSTSDTRNWQRWGDTWPQVFWSWMTSPLAVFQSLRDSDFANFNREFLYLPVLNPLTWLINQLSGVLFYTANTNDKRFLLYYNASFLLPGMMLSFAFAQHHVVTWALRLTKDSRLDRHLLLSVICALFVFAAYDAATRQPRDRLELVDVGTLVRTDPFMSNPLRRIIRCRRVHSIAADRKTVVFVPFRFDKYLLERADKADVVLLPRLSKAERRSRSNSLVSSAIEALSKTGEYTQVAQQAGYEIHVRKQAICN